MVDFESPGAFVLSGMLSLGTAGIDAAMSLEPEHFTDPVLRNLHAMIVRYTEITGGVLTEQALADLLASADAGKQSLYTETFATLASRSSTLPELKWAVHRVKEIRATELTGEALVKGMEILRGNSELHEAAHTMARTEVLTRLAEIDSLNHSQEAPEGLIREEATDILADYAERKVSARTSGIGFGIAELDNKTGGIQSGELCLIVGFSASGKTSMCIQLAWSAAVQQGKSVAFMTTETLRPQVRRKLLARHSMVNDFGLPEGLNSAALKAGSLSLDQERALERVVADLTGNPAYGDIYLAQVPRGATLATVERRLYQIQRRMPIDLVVIDYLALLRADRKRVSDREELSSIIKEAKQMATTFDDGRGVPVLSPWQVNRTSAGDAERVGYYTSMALAETNEATATSDLIVSLLAIRTDGRNAELRGQILKNRDGETAAAIPITADYATSTFHSTQVVQPLDYLLDSG